MALEGTHVIAVCHDYPADDEAAFNDWYVRFHVPDRVGGAPGFISGRRFLALGDTPRYAALYDLADAAAMGSEEYQHLVRNPDPATRHFTSRFVNAARTVFAVRASAGTGEGGVAGLLAFDTGGRDPAFAGASAPGFVAALAAGPGIVAAHLLQRDEVALATSRQGHVRQGDRSWPWLLVVEALSAEAWGRLRAVDLSPQRLAASGVATELMAGAYRLLCGLHARAAR